MKIFSFISCSIELTLLMSLLNACSDDGNVSVDRFQEKLNIQYTLVGNLLTKDVSQSNNDLTIGCEVLDRDYTDYDQYKEYLVPLGMKKIRLQGGWAKTEKEKGFYDFAWLDHIIDDATSRGLTVWLQTSYGNPIYEGGGTKFLAGGFPSSPEALAAWDKWVEAMATRYKGKVDEWEIWNEPDCTEERIANYQEIIDMNIRTAKIIKKVQPEAKIAALAFTWPRAELVGKCLKAFKEENCLNLFTWISYHCYSYRPEDVYGNVQKMRDTIAVYSSSIKIWQGESGAPSKGHMGGALDNYDWSELSQAKWDLRRMINDHGRDIATGVFSISDMAYGGNDAIKTQNVKGLLHADLQKKITGKKLSYTAVQNFVSVYNLLENRIDASNFKVDTKNQYGLFAYKDKSTNLQSFLVWYSKSIPFNTNTSTPANITVMNGNFKNPVWIDLINGKVFEMSKEDWSSNNNIYIFINVPIYDSPILITDKSLIQYK